MKQRAPWVIAVLALLLIVAVGVAYYLWQQQRALAPSPPAAPVAEAPPPAVPEAPASPPAAGYPIEAAGPVASAAELPPPDRADAFINDALVGLLGRDSVLRFLNVDRFAHRVAATVDNLPRETASARLWPVNPPADRFTVEEQGDAKVLGEANARRYVPFVRMVESMDSHQIVALYLRLYPLFQQAYENLGYPGKPFNDRVVQAIDNLLATPEPQGPVRLTLTEIHGPVRPQRPWVRYEYADPALESLSAGQKMMLRMGPDNERRLKAKLRDLRKLIAPAAPPAAPPVRR